MKFKIIHPLMMETEEKPVEVTVAERGDGNRIAISFHHNNAHLRTFSFVGENEKVVVYDNDGKRRLVPEREQVSEEERLAILTDIENIKWHLNRAGVYKPTKFQRLLELAGIATEGE